MKPTKPTPAGWSRIAAGLTYEEPSKAIDWLCEAFGFAVRIKVEEAGVVHHSELTYGEGLIMVGGSGTASARPERTWRKSPRSLDGACTQTQLVFVDDADAHCAHARATGAKIVTEPTTTDYGEGYWIDRGYEAVDLEGHHWWFVQRIGDHPKGEKP